MKKIDLDILNSKIEKVLTKNFVEKKERKKRMKRLTRNDEINMLLTKHNIFQEYYDIIQKYKPKQTN